MGIYHIGVASCIKDHASRWLKSLDHLYGCSAGSLIAAALLTDFPLDEATKFCTDLAEHAYKRPLGPFHPRFHLEKILRKSVEKMLPDDIHLVASGRLSISMTRVKDRKNVIVSEYPTRKDFIDALMCSSFVPFYSGVVPPTFLNTAYVDGGLSDNLPGNELSTVTVSPFSGISSISPKDKSFSAGHVYLSNNSFDITLENMNRLASAFLPPKSEDLINLCRTGYYDAFEFLRQVYG